MNQIGHLLSYLASKANNTAVVYSVSSPYMYKSTIMWLINIVCISFLVYIVFKMNSVFWLDAILVDGNYLEQYIET